MSDHSDDERILREIIARRGAGFVQSVSQDADVADLTIVSNSGVHPIPTELIVGELYVASSGNLDFSSIETVNAEWRASPGQPRHGPLNHALDQVK